jgi:curved DNA-binding protein
MKWPDLPDYYEILQVSRHAHPVVITKTYRLLAALYHPDNKETGDTGRFQQVMDAAKELTDPVRRAAYDRERFGARPINGNGGAAFPEDAGLGWPRHAGDQRTQRRILLQALYNMRRNRPNQPGLSLMVILELLGCTVDETQFTLWYLRGKKFIEPVDEGWAITVAGVDFVESSGLDPGTESPAAEMLSLAEPRNAIEAL